MTNTLNSPTAGHEGPSLASLHAQLREMAGKTGETAATAAKQITAEIRQWFPAAAAGGACPHPKTPRGRTQVLHMNYMQSQSEPQADIEMAHLQFFAQTAQALGLRLAILTHGNSQTVVETELAKDAYKALDYTLTASQNPVAKWAEDSVEYLENGQVAVLTRFDQPLLESAMVESRRHRWQGQLALETLDEALRDDHLWIPLGIRVNASETGVERELAAQTQGQQVGHIRAYIEGGNMITGEDAMGNPIVLVGKDAIGATAYLYQRHDDEVRQIICEDFGLDSISQVIAVEQPGQFHLDMGLLFLGHGVVIVNDSGEALKDAVEMAELVPCLTTNTMAAKLTLQHGLEAIAAQDLAAAGLVVKRERLGHDALYNFFNGEFVEGQDGRPYYITNGGPREQEERFEALMVGEWQIVDKVVFSPQSVAQRSLQEQGGVGCRLKGSRQ